jgi:hypothetical protein
MNVIEYQRLPVTAISERQLNPSALLQLRALDEMERLALTQVAAARQRKREILSRHGIPVASRVAGRILVMRSVASTEGSPGLGRVRALPQF